MKICRRKGLAGARLVSVANLYLVVMIVNTCLLRVSQRERSCFVCFSIEKEECDIPMDSYEWNMPKHLFSKQMPKKRTRRSTFSECCKSLPCCDDSQHIPLQGTTKRVFMFRVFLGRSTRKINADLPEKRSTFGECCKSLPCCDEN